MRFRCADCGNVTKFVKVKTVKRKNELKLAIVEWIADLTFGSQINHGRWSKETTFQQVAQHYNRMVICKECNSNNVFIGAQPNENPYK